MSSSNNLEDAQSLVLVPEKDDLLLLASQFIQKSPSQFTNIASKLESMLEKYQEQPSLLDPFLSQIISKITDAILKPGTQLLDLILVDNGYQSLFSLLYTLTKIRGYKTISKFLPHMVENFELVASLLLLCCDSEMANWKVTYSIFIWMSTLAMIPFSIQSMDSAFHESHSSKQLTPSLIRVSKSYLQNTGKLQDGAVIFLARLLTRPDMSDVLNETIQEASEFTRQCRNDSKVMGYLMLMAMIFKLGRRDVLSDKASQVFHSLWPLAKEREKMLSKTNRLFLVKSLQRVILVILPTKIASWRYSRGCRVLRFDTKSNPEVVSRKEDVKDIQQQWDENQSYNGLIENVALVENVIEFLLRSLRHSDSVIRWSAAKGLGRITSRLPLLLGQDIVDAIIQEFISADTDQDDDAKLELSTCTSEPIIHGCCLALAELARRGLILPESRSGCNHLRVAVNVVIQALKFDIRKGKHGIGSQIRDAACYICWAMARAYEIRDMRPFASKLSLALLPVAVLDREVNCRRAAAAAFQEFVGRLPGAFACGIDVVTLADYFSLGDRSRSYLEITPKICCLGDGHYLECIVEELVERKIQHWDLNIRVLGSECLGKLVDVDKNRIIELMVFPRIIRNSLDAYELYLRHGALLALCETIPSFQKLNRIPIEWAELLVKIPQELEQKGVFLSNYREQTIEAVSALIEIMSNCRIYDKVCDEIYIRNHTRIVESQIENFSSEKVLNRSSTAYGSLFREYISKEEEICHKVMDDVQSALSESVSDGRVRRAIVCAGFFGPCCGRYSNKILNILQSLVKHIELNTGDVKSREMAIRSLELLYPSYIHQKDFFDEKDDMMCNKIIVGLFNATEDYTVDDRGDIGSFVREASMHAIGTLLGRSQTKRGSGITLEILEDAIGLCVRQCCERIDRTRKVAFESLRRLVYEIDLGAEEENRLEIESLKSFCAAYKDDASTAYENGCCLLETERYWKPCLYGLVATAGGLGYQSHIAQISLNKKLSNMDDSILQRVAYEMCHILEFNIGENRLVASTLQVLHILMSRNQFKKLNRREVDWSLRCGKNVRLTLNRSQDMGHMIIAASVLGELAQFKAAGCREICLEGLINLLKSRYSKVRSAASESLYLYLMSCYDEDEDGDEDSVRGGDGQEKESHKSLMEMLEMTRWDKDIKMDERKELGERVALGLGLREPVNRDGAKPFQK